MKFLTVVHAGSERASEIGRTTSARLIASGHQVDSVLHADSPLDPDQVELASTADLVVSLGGDGTMLRSIEAASPAGVPVLGVNLGILGYLTGIEPTQLDESLDSFIDGKYAIEERTTLEVTVQEPGGEAKVVFEAALNEAVLERSIPGHTVRIGVTISGTFFATFAADGMLVCSATGSTAYNLSARGPILSPALDALVLTPISPHMLFDRPLVLSGDEQVGLEVLETRNAVLVVDGIRVDSLSPGSQVTCARSPHKARLVAFAIRNFHNILKSKFHLADR
ncbi:MAG TPA: NAD(+)/NADH kinase [Acidimicrobiales bacterium]|nr:NAD(+)/NADH kinase [Acidimicrobiales bacterium]